MRHIKLSIVFILLFSWTASIAQSRKNDSKNNKKDNGSTNSKEDIAAVLKEELKNADLSSEGISAYSLDEAMQNPELVTKLVLKKEGFNTVPSEIFKLKNLKELDLSDNNINDLPQGFFTLKNLEILNLSGNKLPSIPTEICSLNKLTSLNLSNNLITGGSVSCLNDLERLYLNSNKLISVPSGISELKSLKSLFIQANDITELPEKIGELPKLQILVAYMNKIAIEPRFLKAGRYAKILFYPQNLASSAAYIEVKNETDLENVNARFNINLNSDISKTKTNVKVSEGAAENIEDFSYNIRSYDIGNGYRLIKIGDHPYKHYSDFRILINVYGYILPPSFSTFHWIFSKRHRDNIRLTYINNQQKNIVAISQGKVTKRKLRYTRRINRSTVKIYRRYLRSHGITAP